MEFSEGGVLPESIALAVVICMGLAAYGTAKQGKDKLKWQEHVTRFFCVGIVLVLLGSVMGWAVVMTAGILMFAPMTLVAVSGLMYVFDDAVRGFRKR